MKYESIVKFGWDQNKAKVKIYITSGLDGVGKIPKENTTCEYEDNSLDLKVQGLNGKNYRLRIPELHQKIKFAECSHNVKSNGITITLIKDDADEHWTDVRPKVGLLGKSNDEKKKEADDKDPMASMQNMLKNMYQNGDDKTKAMIAESWQKAQDEKKPDSLTSKLKRI